MFFFYYILMKRMFKRWWNSTMSTKRTITSPLKSLDTKHPQHMPIENQVPFSRIYAHKCGGFKPVNKTSIGLVWFLVFNATANNSSVISWWSVLSVEKTTDLPQVTDKLYHIMLYRLNGNRTHNVSGDSTDCIGSYKIQLPYYHDHGGI